MRITIVRRCGSAAIAGIAAVAMSMTLCCAAAIGPASAEALPRVASTALCADQFVMGLAAPEQIVSVSWQADGPLSLFADRYRGWPTNRGEAEELLYLEADIVVTPAWQARDTREMLERFGVTVVEIPLVNGFAEIRALTLRVATAIRRPEAGRQAVADLDASLAAAADLVGSDRPVAAYYRPGGGSAGIGTFVDTALQAAGLRNLKAEIGAAGWGRLSLETVLTHRPDLFVTSFFDTAHQGRMIGFSRHPMLVELLDTSPLAQVPGRAWVCGGWFIHEAVDALVAHRLAAQEVRPR